MATRRMFSKSVVDTDKFLDMPIVSQVLYFHLGMNADDDGFLSNTHAITRQIGASDKDLEILVKRNYLIAFESGIYVITHWKINNELQKDRYRPTIYTEEYSKLRIEKNRTYTLKNKPDI